MLGRVELVEDEVAEGVGDEDAIADFEALDPVSLVANNEVGAGIDGGAEGFEAAVAGAVGVFGAGLNLDDDDVDFFLEFADEPLEAFDAEEGG